MYPTITIHDGTSATILCHGAGARAIGEWRLEGAIEPSCDFARQTTEPVRAPWWIPVPRATRRPRLAFRVARLHATLEAARETHLVHAATLPAAGTLYVNLSATRRIAYASAALASCTVTHAGLLVTAAYTFEHAAVTPEDYNT